MLERERHRIIRNLVEDRSVGKFPSWFTDLGQKGFIGSVTLSILILVIGAAIAGVVALVFLAVLAVRLVAW